MVFLFLRMIKKKNSFFHAAFQHALGAQTRENCRHEGFRNSTGSTVFMSLGSPRNSQPRLSARRQEYGEKADIPITSNYPLRFLGELGE